MQQVLAFAYGPFQLSVTGETRLTEHVIGFKSK